MLPKDWSCNIVYNEPQVKSEDRWISQLEYTVFVLETYENVQELVVKKQWQFEGWYGIDYDLRTGSENQGRNNQRHAIFSIYVIVYCALGQHDKVVKNVGSMFKVP